VIKSTTIIRGSTSDKEQYRIYCKYSGGTAISFRAEFLRTQSASFRFVRNIQGTHNIIVLIVARDHSPSQHVNLRREKWKQLVLVVYLVQSCTAGHIRSDCFGTSVREIPVPADICRLKEQDLRHLIGVHQPINHVLKVTLLQVSSIRLAEAEDSIASDARRKTI
jgi:hypothetical protein